MQNNDRAFHSSYVPGYIMFLAKYVIEKFKLLVKLKTANNMQSNNVTISQYVNIEQFLISLMCCHEYRKIPHFKHNIYDTDNKVLSKTLWKTGMFRNNKKITCVI